MNLARTDIATYDVGPRDRDLLASHGDRLAACVDSPDDREFLLRARATAFRCLPEELIAFLEAYRVRETAPLIAIRGLVVDDARIGPTPSHWALKPEPHPALPLELLFVLVGSLLGDAFGWETLQDGHLVQNVLPIVDQESEQSGHGSLVNLAWHTEDGFHPYRCDYLGLLGIRNHGGVPTTFATLSTVDLQPDQRRVLSQPRFVIRPDDEHMHQRTRSDGAVEVPDWWSAPAPIAVLFGDVGAPYLRIDPYFMCSVTGDEEAATALAALVAALDDALQDLVIAQGTMCFIDNYRAVHGRRAFTPGFDGTDRWLKKLVVTRDLRKSRGSRGAPDGRVIRTGAEAVPG